MLFVLFDYYNHRNQHTPDRRVHPTGLFHGKTQWFEDVHSFVVGIDYPRKVERTFAIDRMFNVRFVCEDLEAADMTVPQLVATDLTRRGQIGAGGLRTALVNLNPEWVNLVDAYLDSISMAVSLRREIEMRRLIDNPGGASA